MTRRAISFSSSVPLFSQSVPCDQVAILPAVEQSLMMLIPLMDGRVCSTYLYLRGCAPTEAYRTEITRSPSWS